jgi:hypothetical protein
LSAWEILKNIWIKINAEKLPIEADYFNGPMHDLVFNSDNETHKKSIDFGKNNIGFLNNLLLYFNERDEIYSKITSVSSSATTRIH